MNPRSVISAGLVSLVIAAGCSKTSDPAPICPRAGECVAGSAELRAQGMHSRAQRMPAPLEGTAAGRPMHGGAACALGSGPLSDAVRDGIARALADERRAEAEYAQLAGRFGGAPLANITRSERRHEAELERLLAAHSHEAPTISREVPAVAAANVREACAAGVASEKRNIALYDELLAASLPTDVRCVFERLRAVSVTRHLPAFERCAAP